MKIFLLTDNHTPTGGAEQYFFELKHQLQQAGHQVCSAGLGPQEEQGEDYFQFKGSASTLGKLLNRLRVNKKLLNKLNHALQAFKPDIVHIHNIKKYTPTFLTAIDSYPTIQTIHDYGAVCPVAYNIHKDLSPCSTGFSINCFWQHQMKYPKWAYPALVYLFLKTKKSILKQVNYFFAPSPLLVETLKKNNYSNALYLPPFIPKKRVNALTVKHAPLFLFAGNLGAHKGIHILLAEFALACKQNSALRLIIAGEGKDHSRLTQVIKKWDLKDHVRLIGWQTNLASYYLQARAVIFPSLWMEAFGLVITEAMSYGCPVIGSNRGSVPWLIQHNESGCIFDPTIKGDLAKNILRLANDPTLAQTLGIRAYQTLHERFDNQQTLGMVIETYQRIIDINFTNREQP